MAEFPGNPTPVSEPQMAKALVAAFQTKFGRAPDRQTAELLLALLDLENAHGSAVIEHNWGNISTNASPNTDYWRPPWFDLEKVSAMPDNDDKKKRYLALHAQMLAGKVPSAFLAFPDDVAGLQSFLRSVKPSMYDAAQTGDPMRFASAYFSSGYCPDQACKDSGPTYKKLQQSIRAAGYFNALPNSGRTTSPFAILAPLGVAGYLFVRTLRLKGKT